MTESDMPTGPPVERSEDDEENDAHRAMIRQKLASVAAWAAERQHDDDARRRKVPLVRTRTEE